MDPLMTSAAGGMRARLESLEMLANNLANASTAGYKSDREFYSLYTAPEALEGLGPSPGVQPLVDRLWTDFSQGTITPTGNPLDIALTGKGFFVASGPAGALYTRNGSLRLSPAGVLTTSEGYAMRGVDGRPIQAQGTGPVEIAADGTVRQDGAPIGQLAVVEVPPGGLEKQGRNYFRLAPGAAADPASQVQIQQGKLEASNVSAPESAVRLVNLMRQFEMLQRAIALGAEMNRRAEEVAKATQ
jgi:flagellar basal body rod protein FlgG